MKHIIISLLCIIPLLARGEGITNGQYEISFQISDMYFRQEVSITNYSWFPDRTTMYYDVVVEKNGSFKRSDGDRQTVRGILCMDNLKFRFIIPCVNGEIVDAYVFEGSNVDTNGVLEGTGDVPYQGPNGGNNKFRFQMKRRTPNNHVEATR